MKNFGGTVEDILLKTGGSGALGGFSWMANYFPVRSDVVFQQDIWTYTLNGDSGATARKMVQTGVYSSGSPTTIGDIITG